MHNIHGIGRKAFAINCKCFVCMCVRVWEGGACFVYKCMYDDTDEWSGKAAVMQWWLPVRKHTLLALTLCMHVGQCTICMHKCLGCSRTRTQLMRVQASYACDKGDAAQGDTDMVIIKWFTDAHLHCFNDSNFAAVIYTISGQRVPIRRCMLTKKPHSCCKWTLIRVKGMHNWRYDLYRFLELRNSMNCAYWIK